MTKSKIEEYRKSILEKKDLLHNVFIQLKKEFIGIDTVIDQMEATVAPWFLFPDMQDRPLIINLWGLTGTGKTSLVKRLTELIGFADYYFRFDLGESSKRYYDMQESLKDIYENCDGKPVVIGLDEFQLARTINENQEEIDRSSIRAIWDLLDRGQFEVIDFNYNLSWFNKLIKKLDLALYKGVVVAEGRITEGLVTFNEIILAGENEDNDDDEKEKTNDKKETYFVRSQELRNIYNMVDHLFLTEEDLRTKLNELDGDQTIDYLIYLYKVSLKPRTVDCTKALIFVMGNLDEVYSMNRNFNPDISANEFHRQSLKITITEVKSALLSRFRSEQIARLGNNHIIYPAFNEKTFYAIIDVELEKVRKKVQEVYQIEMIFCTEIKRLIYEEGVYPTQGTRPLFTTIHQLINARLGRLLNEIFVNDFTIDTVVLTVDPSKAEKDCTVVQIDFLKENQRVHRLLEQQPLTLGKLRKETKDDLQAIVAVHESGHAILSALLLKTLPEAVFSVTADSESNGFVLARPEWNYVSKKEIINRLAVLLGGWVAERLVFGEENVTIGSGADLSNATHLATHVVYSCGMGHVRAAFGNENMATTPSVIFDHAESVNKDAKELLVQAEHIATGALERQKSVLLHLADYLSDHSSANKQTIRAFLENYAVDFNLNELIENAEHLFYREHLKKLIEKF